MLSLPSLLVTVASVFVTIVAVTVKSMVVVRLVLVIGPSDEYIVVNVVGRAVLIVF